MKWNIHVHMRSNPIGFHTSLTPEAHNKILYAVNSGLSNEDIAALADIHPRTLQIWLERGSDEGFKNEDTIFAHLFKDFIKEKALFKKSKIDLLTDKPSDIKWLLERIYPETFGENSSEIKELIKNIQEIKHKIGSGDHGNGNTNNLASQKDP